MIGLSIDQVFSHIKWVDWIEENLQETIEFPVIADDMGKVAQALGMVHPGKGTNTVRAVFIVDPQGTLRLMLYYPQDHAAAKERKNQESSYDWWFCYKKLS